MPNEEQRVSEYVPPLIISDWQTEPADRAASAGYNAEAAEVASREAAERDAAFVRALNRPAPRPTELPRLKQFVLPDDFQARLAALDDQIYDRGVAVNKDKLVALGSERFQELLACDRRCRSLQRVVTTITELSSWPSVADAFARAGALVTSIQPRTDSEIVAGAGVDREQAARIDGFADLWKAAPERETVMAVYAFHDTFAGLMFGQHYLLELIGSDGRAHSHSFCGGTSRKAGLFRDWFSVLEGPHFQVLLDGPLWHLVAWLADEHTPPPDATEWARYWFDVRSPSRTQTRVTDAVLEGFALGHSGWSLWNYVGRATRQLLGETQLQTWHNELGRRYRAIAAFHAEASAAFVTPASVSGHSYWQLDEQACRAFIGEHLRQLANQVSGVMALALEETLGKTCVARHQDWLLREIKNKQRPLLNLGDLISQKLAAAFPGAGFQVAVKEIPS